jgi:hypothetical protein
MSPISSEAGEAVLHYKRKLTRHLEDESPEIVLHCLDKLEQIPVNISILQDTGIGKVVNHLKKSESADESVIEKARSIVQKWKDIVSNEERETTQEAEDGNESGKEDSGSEQDDEDGGGESDPPPVLVPEFEARSASSKSKHVSHSKSEDISVKKSKHDEDLSSSSSR